MITGEQHRIGKVMQPSELNNEEHKVKIKDPARLARCKILEDMQAQNINHREI